LAPAEEPADVVEPEFEEVTPEPVVEVAEEELEALAVEYAAEPDAEEEPAEPEIEVGALSIAGLVSALEADPSDYGTQLSLARAYVEDKAWDAAASQYESLARSAPDLVDEVIGDLEGVTEGQPDLLSLQQTLGDALMEAGRLDEALAKYNWVLKQM
jgi:tetratricopeptide (TPR) repeat protein